MLFGRKRTEQPVKTEPFFVAYRDDDPNGPMTVTIDPDQVESASHAGLMLADFARHFARAMSQAGKSESEGQALQDVVKLFNAEIDHPTGPVDGAIRN